MFNCINLKNRISKLANELVTRLAMTQAKSLRFDYFVDIGSFNASPIIFFLPGHLI